MQLNKVTNMQIIATYNGDEISSGEGQGYRYAIEDCIDNMPEIFTADAETICDVQLEFVGANPGACLPKYCSLADYFYEARQYF
jgi:hypothetical protein